MKISLITVGKTDVKWVKEGLELYAGRLSHYIQFTINEIPVILLDEHGKEFRSVEFASYIQNKMACSGRNIAFVIGGAYGFSQKVYDRADSKMSLSKMTFSHQMVRTIFAEQLYRAFTIIKGEPYHHE